MSKPSTESDDLRRALRSCMNGILGVGAFSFLINLLVLAGPLYMMLVYDRALGSGSIPTLVGLSVLLGGLFLIMGLLTIVRSRILVRMANRLAARLQSRAFASELKEAARSRSATGESPTRDLDVLRDFVGGQTPGFLFDVPWAPVFIGFAYVLHPLLGLIALAGAAVLLVMAVLNDFWSKRHLTEARASLQESNRTLEDARRNADIVTAMDMGPHLFGRWDRHDVTAQKSRSAASDASATYLAISRTFRMTLQSAVLGVGAYLAIGGQLSPGAIIAASVVVARGLAPIEQAIGGWRQLVAARGAYKRLSTALAAHPVGEDRMTLPTPKGAISVRKLFAAAPGQTIPTLQGVSFDLSAGYVLGIVGPSGSGKSTLARALVGAWAPMKGEVRLDGAELQHWRPQQLGSALGYLPQDVELFDGTVRENIGRFREDADDKQVLIAAQMAGAHDLIMSLPDGYETRLGQGGARLSGGERQRIGLARAVYGDPALVVLDEPNASLDGAGEAALQEAIKILKLFRRTVVIIAHRPSALALADKVLVLTRGRVDAFGPRQEILNASAKGIQVVGGRQRARASERA